MAPITHVPAWKKLGLKLKFAKDIPVDEYNGAEVVLQKKRERREEDATSITQKPPKKAKISKNTVIEPSATHVSNPPVTSSEISDPSIPTHSTTFTKQKSVSFTPETKTKDGDSVKQLYNKWLAEQTSDFNPRTSPEALRSVTPIPSSDKTEPSKVKKTKKPKPSKQSRTDPDTTTDSLSTESKTTTNSPHTPQFLHYLTHHHTSPQTWKFNKAKQIALLKNLFDLTVIPSSYDLALTSYLSGLASPVTRFRLCETAVSVLNEASSPSIIKPETRQEPPKTITSGPNPPETMDPAAVARKKSYYLQALRDHTSGLEITETLRSEREKEADPAWKLKLQKRKRALLILSAMCYDEFGEANVIRQGTAEGSKHEEVKKTGGRVAPALKKRRRRKRRTGVPDDDSTSEESSSSDSDDDDGSGEGKKGSSRLKISIHSHGKESESEEDSESTSSSSSSSSSES